MKLAAYHRAGIPHYWVVDPIAQTLTVFRRGADGEGYETVRTAGRSDVVKPEPFEAAELHVVDLFGGEA